MLKVKHNTNEIVQVLERLQGSIHPQRVLLRALKSATRQVKTSYAMRWNTQLLGYGMSYWSVLKGKAGFFTGLGFFTGTTYRSINYRFLSGAGVQPATEAKGEVAPQGRWPQPPYGSSTIKADESPGMDWWTLGKGKSPDDPSDATYGIEPPSQSSVGPRLSIYKPGLGDDEYIQVGPFGALVKYPRSKKAFGIPSEEMRTKMYGPKKRGGVDFMYLDPKQEDTIFGDVVNIISQSIDRL